MDAPFEEAAAPFEESAPLTEAAPLVSAAVSFAVLATPFLFLSLAEYNKLFYTRTKIYWFYLTDSWHEFLFYCL